ncbi:hypothetical protein DXG03_007636 [Asterophora parasitica]|uniref:Uncharacterized protein n=1 Tax=Asterophora parasitica TaxID=117018 RepID=A0A9P7G6N4_9AGAR|nr:hypothetical protein DXG03_007636 [Asterophora parasitica]
MRLSIYVLTYDTLRREYRDRAPHLPRLRMIYEDIEKRTVQEVIFLVRGVVFEDDSQLDPACDKHRALWMPNDTGWAEFDAFEIFVESVGAKVPDAARAGFASIKGIHPAFEYRDRFRPTSTFPKSSPFLRLKKTQDVKFSHYTLKLAALQGVKRLLLDHHHKHRGGNDAQLLLLEGAGLVAELRRIREALEHTEKRDGWRDVALFEENIVSLDTSRPSLLEVLYGGNKVRTNATPHFGCSEDVKRLEQRAREAVESERERNLRRF